MLLGKLNLAIKLLLVFLLSFFLFACVYNSSITEDSIIVDDLGLHSIPHQNNTIKKAVAKLENGDNLEAKYIIQQVLRINPKHTKANLLQKQLTLSAKDLFKTNRFTDYKVRPGDSLGSIAKTWLNDPIYFVSLAILNKIKYPKKITHGFLLKIPVIDSSPLVKQEKRHSKINLTRIKTQINHKKYLKAIESMNSLYISSYDESELIEVQKNALSLFAKSKISISERHKMVAQIKNILSSSKQKKLHKDLQKFIDQQHYSVLVDEFNLLFEDESFNQAAAKLIQAKKIMAIQPQNTSLIENKNKLIDKLHENAIILRKNQQLKQAAKTWQIILEIQPENKLANRYYSRTQKLLERLQELN